MYTQFTLPPKILFTLLLLYRVKLPFYTPYVPFFRSRAGVSKVNPPTYKKGKSLFMALSLRVLIFNKNLNGHKLWHVPNFG